MSSTGAASGRSGAAAPAQSVWLGAARCCRARRVSMCGQRAGQQERGSAERRPQPTSAEALVALSDTALASAPNRTGGDRYQVVVHVDAGALANDDHHRPARARPRPLGPTHPGRRPSPTRRTHPATAPPPCGNDPPQHLRQRRRREDGPRTRGRRPLAAICELTALSIRIRRTRRTCRSCPR